MNLFNKGKIVALTFVLATALTNLTACNTMEGVGEDVEAAGDTLDDAASENNDYKHRSN